MRRSLACPHLQRDGDLNHGVTASNPEHILCHLRTTAQVMRSSKRPTVGPCRLAWASSMTPCCMLHTQQTTVLQLLATHPADDLGTWVKVLVYPVAKAK